MSKEPKRISSWSGLSYRGSRESKESKRTSLGPGFSWESGVSKESKRIPEAQTAVDIYPTEFDLLLRVQIQTCLLQRNYHQVDFVQYVHSSKDTLPITRFRFYS